MKKTEKYDPKIYMVKYLDKLKRTYAPQSSLHYIFYRVCFYFSRVLPKMAK